MANRSTGIYGHFGRYSATAQLPNVAGADVQSSEVALGDLAVVGTTLYLCTTATLGAAVWGAIGTVSGGAPGGAWVPTVTPAAGTTPTIVDASGSYTRSGVASPANGDVVRLAIAFSVVIAAGQTMSFVLSALPATASLTSESPMLQVTRQSGDATAPFIFAQLSGADAITVAAVGAVTLETTVLISIDFTYRVAL